MSIEVREEKPSERRFAIHWGAVDSWRNVTEAELRELVEKGADALGDDEIRVPISWRHTGGNCEFWDQAKAAERENTRLRAWLKAIEAEETYRKTAYMASKALAGEEAPTP